MKLEIKISKKPVEYQEAIKFLEENNELEQGKDFKSIVNAYQQENLRKVLFQS